VEGPSHPLTRPVRGGLFAREAHAFRETACDFRLIFISLPSAQASATRIFLRGRDAAGAENERLGLQEEDFIPAAFMTSRVTDEPIQQG
jgi:hypothetical protein